MSSGPSTIYAANKLDLPHEQTTSQEISLLQLVYVALNDIKAHNGSR
jgi:hypothetical protein